MSDNTKEKVMIRPEQVTHCIYHDKCPDGVGSALAVALLAKEQGRKVQFFGVHPNADLTSLPLDGAVVVMCDISNTRANLEKLLTRVAGFLLVDHHKTAQQDLVALEPQLKIFDMKRSGAGLTWNWCFPDRPLPRVLELIEDRDLWTKKFPESSHLSNWYTTIYLEEFSVILEHLERLLDLNELNKVIELGRCFGVLTDSIVAREAKYAYLELAKLNDRYYIVGRMNSTIYPSDIGNRILLDHPLADFSVVFSLGYQSTRFSLRSADDRADVSEIAKLYQGGGHRNASGCSVPNIVDRLPGRYYDLHIEETMKTMEIATLMIDQHEVIWFSFHSNRHRYALLSYVSQNPILVAKRLNKTVPERCDLVLVWKYDPLGDVAKIKYKFLSDSKEKELAFKKRFSITDPENFTVKGVFRPGQLI
jgi:uncharacterized protein